MWKSVTLVSLCLLITPARGETELKGTAADLSAHLASVPKLVSIAGESELKVPADRALISLKVVTESKSLQEASRANQEIRARILRTLAEQGVPNERVKASRFSSTPKYGVFREKARSYRVENIVKIAAQDEKEFQAVANLVYFISEVRYESIEFEHSDKEGLKAKALAQAIDKAGEKKKLCEEKLGVKLSPKRFTESGGVTAPNVAGTRYAISVYKGGSGTALPGERAGEPDEAETPTSFSELIYKAQVTVEYALESR